MTDRLTTITPAKDVYAVEPPTPSEPVDSSNIPSKSKDGKAADLGYSPPERDEQPSFEIEKRKPAMAFIVDVSGESGEGSGKSPRSINDSLSQFLPTRRQQNMLQRRSGLRQKFGKGWRSLEGGNRRPDSGESGREQLRKMGSSAEEELSEDGTYVLEDELDTVAEARDCIRDAFGINFNFILDDKSLELAKDQKEMDARKDDVTRGDNRESHLEETPGCVLGATVLNDVQVTFHLKSPSLLCSFPSPGRWFWFIYRRRHINDDRRKNSRTFRFFQKLQIRDL